MQGIPTESHWKPHLCQLSSSVAGSLLYRLIELFLDQDNIFWHLTVRRPLSPY